MIQPALFIKCDRCKEEKPAKDSWEVIEDGKEKVHCGDCEANSLKAFFDRGEGK